jgi:hypothetical protein
MLMGKILLWTMVFVCNDDGLVECLKHAIKLNLIIDVG